MNTVTTQLDAETLKWNNPGQNVQPGEGVMVILYM